MMEEPFVLGHRKAIAVVKVLGIELLIEPGLELGACRR
jgi:hypothetical protein